MTSLRQDSTLPRSILESLPGFHWIALAFKASKRNATCFQVLRSFRSSGPFLEQYTSRENHVAHGIEHVSISPGMDADGFAPRVIHACERRCGGLVA